MCRRCSAAVRSRERSLIRPMLVTLGSDASLFMLLAPHIVTDGWSMGILFREKSALYATACQPQLAGVTRAPLAVQRLRGSSARVAVGGGLPRASGPLGEPASWRALRSITAG